MTPLDNQMHKQMLRISSRIRQTALEHATPQAIYEHLPILRFSPCRHLLTAERLLESLTGSLHTIVEEADYDGDDETEVFIESHVTDYCFKPSLRPPPGEKPGSGSPGTVRRAAPDSSHTPVWRTSLVMSLEHP